MEAGAPRLGKFCVMSLLMCTVTIVGVNITCDVVLVRRCRMIDCFVLKLIYLLKFTSERGV